MSKSIQNWEKLTAVIVVLGALTLYWMALGCINLPLQQVVSHNLFGTPIHERVIMTRTVVPITTPAVTDTAPDTPISTTTEVEMDHVSSLNWEPSINRFAFTYDGKMYSENLTLYQQACTEMYSVHPFIGCTRMDGDNSSCTGAELTQAYTELLNNKAQDAQLAPLIKWLKEQSDDTNQQAIIATRLVQNIPYAKYSDTIGFPYETLYYQQGLCGDKSVLLAYMLNKLGFDTVLFYFVPENHEAVGIKCEQQYSYQGTGYCFVETTRPTMITDSSNTYGDTASVLSSLPELITPYSGGVAISGIDQEYQDAIRFHELNNISNANGNELPLDQYLEWDKIIKKYGISVSH
jgi:hypothetical protein